MAFKLNPLTGRLDITNNSSSSGVTRVGSTTDKSITRWLGNNANTIQGSLASVQDGGAVQASGFVGTKDITTAVELPNNHYMVATGLTIELTGSVTVGTDSELVLI